MRYELVVMGVSAGGLQALSLALPVFPKHFRVPIVVVQHLLEGDDSYLAEHLSQRCELTVVEACDKAKLVAGTVYIAPPGYHTLIEEDQTINLSADPRVNFSRPSINVLFETAAEVYQRRVMGVLLTGANGDGAEGLFQIHKNGGYTIVQDPNDAQSKVMPESALALFEPNAILPMRKIAAHIIKKIGEGYHE